MPLAQLPPETLSHFLELLLLMSLLGGVIGSLLWPALLQVLVWCVVLFARLVVPRDRQAELRKHAFFLAKRLRHVRAKLREFP